MGCGNIGGWRGGCVSLSFTSLAPTAAYSWRVQWYVLLRLPLCGWAAACGGGDALATEG